MVCNYCNVTFKPNKYSPNQKFCSKRCSRKYNYEHRNGQPFICKYCGKTFIPKAKDRIHYCSRECYFKQKKEIGLEQTAATQEAERIVREAAKRKVCRVCGKQFQAESVRNKICSRECRLKEGCSKSLTYSINQHKLKQFKCKECSKVYSSQYGDKKRQFCSKECCEKYSTRIGKGTRRARQFAARYESVNPIAILNRDNWHCKLCGRSTPRKYRGTTKDNAPEIDHIIPLALGGSHTFINLQCLCRKCNQLKGVTPKGQLVLC